MKFLTRTPIMGEYHPTMVPNRLTQPYSSAVNLDESSSMPSVKGIDPYEASSAALHLLSEEVINKVCDSAKLSNSIICQYLTELILDVITAP